MARKRSASGSYTSQLLGLAIIVALVGGAWYVRHRQAVAPVASGSHAASDAIEISADRVDPANEGRLVVVSGTVRANKPAQDPQLGIRSDSAILWRIVEMLQWTEQCDAGHCSYALDWSGQPVDSSTFHDKEGHANPVRLPFSSERFPGEGVHLGAFAIDPAFAADPADAIPYAVRAAQLPPNLAATFREKDGALYATVDAGHPTAGDLRVVYRVLAPGPGSWRGIQSGERLKSAPKH